MATPESSQEPGVRPMNRLAAIPPLCDGEEPCEPPIEFTREVCKGSFPGLAIFMFEKGSPWQRLYLKVDQVPAVNAYGSRATSQPLTYGEEVLVLRGESADDESDIQISGASDVDLLRWDGTCVTVRREFFATYMMPETTNATIAIRRLDEDIQTALLEQKYVGAVYKQQRLACRGSRVSNPSPECAKATRRLNDAITVAVRGGMEVPVPDKLPEWATPDQLTPNQDRLSQADSSGY